MTEEDQSRKEEKFRHEKYIYERYIRPQYGIIKRIRWRITKKVRSIKDSFGPFGVNPIVAIIVTMMGIMFLALIISTIIDIYVILFPRVEETTFPRYVFYGISMLVGRIERRSGWWTNE